jgi:hypothetical protein
VIIPKGNKDLKDALFGNIMNKRRERDEQSRIG